MPRVGFREFFALGHVLANGQLLRYPRGERGYTARFEKGLGKLCGVSHVLSVNSGTNALITALAAAGVGPGDEVLVPAYTWMATAIAPLAVGAVPVLVNVNESLTIDPQDVERHITPNTKAMIPVHMLNLVCDMDPIMSIARKNNLLVIEDASQAIGVSYKGRRVGTIGDLGVFSFNHFKNMTSGEGGAVLTDDERYFIRARMYHDPGSFIRGHEQTDEPLFAGMNCRVSELTGAVLYAQLAKLEPLMKRLRKRHTLISEVFDGLEHCHTSPHNDPDNAVGLTVVFDREEDAKEFAETRGVERLIETDRHVFTNWEAVMEKRSFHPRMNPYEWANREISYDVEDYAPTLDILRRTCRVALGAQYPYAIMQMRKKALQKAVKGGIVKGVSMATA